MKNFVYFIIAISFFSCHDKFTSISFDSQKWKSGDRKVRGRMADSLESGKILLNKNFNEVIQILGEPDIINDDTSRISYEYDVGSKVGPLGLGGPWIFWLNIDFDSTNKKNVIRVFGSD